MESLLAAISDGTKWSLRKLEKLVFAIVVEIIRRELVEILHLLDEYLMVHRDSQRYRLRARRKRTLETMFGPITFGRRYYWDTKERKRVYLLDEQLGLGKRDQVSPVLNELAIYWATKGSSYRDARDRLEDLYGYRVLSHETIRRHLLRWAESAKAREEEEAERAEGRRKVPAIFLESDGLVVALQRRRRRDRPPEGETPRRTEVKIGVKHEGWAPRWRGAEAHGAWRLKNPGYYASLAREGWEYWEGVRGYLSREYTDLDETQIVINGDAANWIIAGLEHFARAIYQYDRFHITRDLRRALAGQKERWHAAREALQASDLPALLRELDLALQGEKLSRRRERIVELRQRITRYWEYIRDYRERLGEAADPSWQAVGSGEAHIALFENRLTGHGRAWGSGLEGMLTALCHYLQGDLRSVLREPWPSGEEPVVRQVVESAASYLSRREARRYALGIRQGRVPLLERGNHGMGHILRRIFGLR
ncbi:MAG: ISLre2 family transposase [Firmicutes bacterium]|nr:ISLre2 family transposase [Bacillota bacterium]